MWEKRGTIRQGSKGTRVPLRDQFNRIPEACIDLYFHEPPPPPPPPPSSYPPGSVKEGTSVARMHLDHCRP